MDNYPYSSQYPYAYPHGYPPPNQDTYPPPPPPPSYQYPYNSQHYPYAQPEYPSPTSHSGPLNYHPPSPSLSGPIPYQYPFPVAPPVPHLSHPPTLQHHHSFQYGSSSSYHYQQPQSSQYPPPESDSLAPLNSQQLGQYPPPESKPQLPSRASSFSNHHRQDSSISLGTNHDTPPRTSAYPPLDDLLSNVHLSDNQPTVPASPPAPAAPPLPTSPSTPGHQSPSWVHGRKGEFYGYPNDSFSSNWEGSYLGRFGVSNNSGFTHSGSFNGSSHSQNQSMQIVPFQKGSLKVLLLHGNLDIWVHDAKNLPNMDMFHKTLGDVFGRLPGNVTNKIEGHMNRKITSDPYVSISVGGAVVGRTFVISNSENPVWMQHFYVPVAHYAAEVHFVVKDSDVVGSQLIGVVAIPVQQIYSGEMVKGTYPILNNSGKPCKPGAVLSLSIQYTPIERLSIYDQGVGAGPDYLGVPGTYFPLRKGGTVTLYQDAHVPDGFLPNLTLDGGMSYVHGKCWHDIFDAIRQARRLIYITGWSVWHNVRLVRDPGPASDCTLGELLRSKSQEGVRVLLLIWDDPTSRSILGYKTVSS